MFGISLFYYYITTASLLCQYLLKNLFKNYFSRKYRYIKAFRDSLFFVEKNFLGFFLFFSGFCIGIGGPEEGPEKSRKSIGRTKRTCRKNTTAHSRPGEIYRTAPEEKKGPKRRDKENRQPDTAEGRRKKGQGKYHMSGGMRQLSMSKGKLGRNCQPFAICRFTLQRESSGSVKGKRFAYILSTAFI